MSALDDELKNITGYSYEVWAYEISHSELTLRATHKDKKNHNFHLTFLNVHYLQMPTAWTGNFVVGSDEEMIEIAGKTHLNETIEKITEKDEYLSHFKRLFALYKAETEHSTVILLGKLFSIEQDVDPVY